MDIFRVLCSFNIKVHISYAFDRIVQGMYSQDGYRQTVLVVNTANRGALDKFLLSNKLAPCLIRKKTV